jgi:thymidylate kinase
MGNIARIAWSAARDEDALPALPRVVAIVGCDGSGKTTLVRDLVRTLNRERPTVRRYMGLVSGEAGDRIKRLPLIGVMLERYLAIKVRRAQDMDKKLPGTFSSIVMYLFSLYRVRQMKRMMRLAESGTLVIADRYPQSEVEGFHFDGPGLAAHRATSRFARNLARREQSLYEWMAQHRPTIVIRLLVEPDVAYRRKPDHPMKELREKIALMPTITYGGAQICEIDTDQPYPAVLAAALAIVRDNVCREEGTKANADWRAELQARAATAAVAATDIAAGLLPPGGI